MPSTQPEPDVLASLEKAVAATPLFAEEPSMEIAKHLIDCKVVSFAPGEKIIRLGEYGEHCCLMLAGRGRVELPYSRDKKKFVETGSIFGEIAALSRRPRTADITAEDSCQVMLISRDKLLKLIELFESVKIRLDDLYKGRILNDMLAQIPILVGISSDVVERIKEEGELVVYKKGEVVCREGDVADSFYVVVYGYLKVHKKKKHGEKILSYLKGEQYFGEVAFLSNNGKRSASVTAISHTELFRIGADGFSRILRDNPKLSDNMRDFAAKREERHLRIAGDSYLAGTLQATVDSGVIQAKATHLLDTTKCIQCNTCVVACAELHDGVSRLTRKGVRLNGFLMVPTSCHHCKDPTCMSKCPTGAIVRAANGEIYYKDSCIGCGSCAKNCAYGNISVVDTDKLPKSRGIFETLFGDPEYKNSTLPAKPGPENGNSKNEQTESATKGMKKSGKTMVKCDMCHNHDMIGCVYHCPTGAMMIVDPGNYFTDLFPTEF